MTITTFDSRTPASPALLGSGSAVVAAALTTYGAHTWQEIAVTVPVILGAAAVVFGVVVPRALRKESAGGTALGLSIPAALLLLPAFWAGLPLVLGLAGVVVGNAGRTTRSGGRACISAVVLGGLTVVGYLAIYVMDAGISGNAGYLFD